MVCKFDDLGSSYGSWNPDTDDLYFNFSPPDITSSGNDVPWTTDYSNWDPPEANFLDGKDGDGPVMPYFPSFALHEVGHLFLGIGHLGNYDIMRVRPLVRELSDNDRYQAKIIYNPEFDITVRNYFSGTLNVDAAGVVTINKSTESAYDETINSGGETVTFEEKELNVLLTAKRQQADGYWQNWDSYQGSVGELSSNSWQLNTVESGNLNIHYLRECNLTFQLYYNSAIQSGTMKFDGSTESVSTTKLVYQESTIQVEALMQTMNNINYYFEKWNEDNNTQNPRTFTASQIDTFTVKMLGYAYTPNVHFVGDPGDFITVAWDDHPNTAVTQYQVWRIDPDHTGGVLLTTKSRGNTSYMDYDYSFYESPGTALNLKYAVIAKYSTDDTWSPKNWQTILGEEDRNIKSTDEPVAEAAVVAEIEETELSYSIGNSPNPFNPTTQISYTLPDAEQVTIKVYNTLGKEVATLVNSVQSKGTHAVTFNADNLASGIYIYTIQTPNYVASKKMILLK